MATLAQIEANRRNSLRSTGPRTQAGKTASSHNAHRTGLYAKSLLIDGEDPAELDDLARHYFESCNPQSPCESALVIQLLRSDWLLRRMTRLESELWNYHTGRIRSNAAENEDEVDEPHLLALAPAEIGFVPSNRSRAAANPPTLGDFPQTESSRNAAIAAKSPKNPPNAPMETLGPFGPLRAYTPPVIPTRKGIS